MPVVFHVTIKKMSGIDIRKLRNFGDDRAKEHSDVMLKIGDQKFYVYKMYLSLHSSYFESLFTGNFSESKKSEIELKDIDAQDFQDFLELIYGDSVIEGTVVERLRKKHWNLNKKASKFGKKCQIRGARLHTSVARPLCEESTVAGILKLADFFESKTAFQRCEEFLLNRSEHSLKIKFHAAIKYKLEKLKKKCFSEMTKNTNFVDLIPESPADFDHEIWAEMYRKVASFV